MKSGSEKMTAGLAKGTDKDDAAALANEAKTEETIPAIQPILCRAEVSLAIMLLERRMLATTKSCHWLQQQYKTMLYLTAYTQAFESRVSDCTLFKS
jgi:hypothetical protein